MAENTKESLVQIRIRNRVKNSNRRPSQNRLRLMRHGQPQCLTRPRQITAEWFTTD